MLSIVNADTCEDTKEITTNCTMLTPTLVCNNLTYSIFNETGTEIVVNNSLTQFNGDIYYFIFNQTAGSYIVELCDGSTREIKVRDEEEEIKMFSIVFGIAVLIAFLIYFGSRINDETIRWVAYTISGVEAVMISMIIYMISLGQDYSSLLKINLYGFGIALFALIMWSLFSKNINMLNSGSEEDTSNTKFEDDGNWSRKW